MLVRRIVATVAAALTLTVQTVAPMGAALYAAGARGLCPTEDSVSCVWIPAFQGNGHGSPVIVVNGPNPR
jgi:hypothetical protein